MKSVVLKRYATRLAIETSAIPVPDKHQVLLKMMYSPVNPSDMYFVAGVYGDKKNLPITPGFEGVGVVERWGDSPDLHKGEIACVSGCKEGPVSQRERLLGHTRPCRPEQCCCVWQKRTTQRERSEASREWNDKPFDCLWDDRAL